MIVPVKAGKISNVVWSEKSTRLAYVIAVAINEEEEEFDNSLFVVDRDGAENRLVRRFRDPTYAYLVGLDDIAHRIFWVQGYPGGGDAGTDTLTAVDASSGKILTKLPSVDAHEFSPAFKRMYFIENETLYEAMPDGTTRRRLYQTQAPETPEDDYPRLLSPLLSHDAQSIFVADWDPRSDAAAIVNIRLSDLSTRTVASNLACRPRLDSLAPDDQWIWVAYNGGCEGHVLEVSSGRTITVPTPLPTRVEGQMQAGLLDFVAWLIQ